MSLVSFEFEASSRVASGKAAARRLRAKEDRVPAIVYGADKAPMPISLSHNKVIKALDHEAVYSHILTLNVDGQPEKVVLKALLRHHIKPKILHMDFLRVDMNKEITMHVPLHFVGDTKSPGLKDGGVLFKLITDLEICCLPSHLPEYIEVDISALVIGDSIHVSEVKLPEHVSLAHELDEDHDQTVVSIHEPREEEPEETAAPVVVETVITGQKSDEEAAAADDAGAAKEKKSADKEKK